MTKPAPDVALEWDEASSAWVAHYTLRRYRFLMSDGQTIDIVAYRDDSNLRAQVLVAAGRRLKTAEERGVLSIEGSVRMPEVEEPPLWES